MFESVSKWIVNTRTVLLKGPKLLANVFPLTQLIGAEGGDSWGIGGLVRLRRSI